jgi:hypothetical protein
MSNNNNDIPFQVEHLVTSLLNQKESVHLRQNYRLRLESIKEHIEKSLKRYDNELYMTNTRRKKV